MIVDGQRPTDQMIEKAWAQNDDGVGLAWREDKKDGREGEREVVWAKGLMELKDAKDYIEAAPMPFVVHFRTASIGGVRPSLTHPFPVDLTAPVDLDGRTNGFVLFHNGHWKDWDGEARQAAVTNKVQIPVGRWSDSRAMAWLCAMYGNGFMELLPDQRGVAFGPYGMDIFTGPGWVKVNGVWCSNDHFLHRGVTTGYSGTSHYSGTYGPTHQTKMCRHPQCTIQVNLDAQGYCLRHPNGKDRDIEEAVNRAKATGGSSNVAPFPRFPKGSIIKLEVAKHMHEQRDSKGNRVLSTQKLKSIVKYYQKMTSPKPKKKEEARKKLEEITQTITCLPSSGPVN